MKCLQCLGLAGALALALLAADGGRAGGDTYHHRQYYSHWSKHPTHNYYYSTYYYKPTPQYVGYKYHYAIHYPSRPKYVYHYNPYKKHYWGRSPAHCDGKPAYAELKEEDRSGNLDEIPEEKFPEFSDVMPRIPESKDKQPLDLPPPPPTVASGTPAQ